MYLAIILIISGVCLIFLGAKIFFGILFLATGVYILSVIATLHFKSQVRTKQTQKVLKEKLEGKLSAEDLQWVLDIAKPPFGKKIFIFVDDENDSTHVRVSIPFSLLIVLKPFAKSLLPFISKFTKGKIPVDEKYLGIIHEVLMASLDELMTYSGDFIHVESKGTTVRIGIA
ncbi:hypothetical protein ACSFC1_08510 [Pseudothermotoga sp. U03pept]|uniref:hypothetical protein n=1 Tax=Pseudothermotoga sp. U03pept TaxID=3447012 RepID=UPI003F0DBA57